MSKVKTFPIILAKEDHQEIKDAAEKLEMPMNKFIMLAISEKIEKIKEERIK